MIVNTIISDALPNADLLHFDEKSRLSTKNDQVLVDVKSQDSIVATSSVTQIL